MKPLIFILLLLVASCGPECKGPDLSNNSIVWQGYASENPDPQFQADIDKTLTCLNNINPDIIRKNLSPSPHIIITEKEIDGFAGHCYFCANTIAALDRDVLTHYTIVHEIIHWATGLGNEAHGSIYFTTCETYFNFN